MTLIKQLSGQESIKMRRPLMIGCSGGGGHIAAIQGISNHFESEFKDNVDLKEYEPVLFSQKPNSPQRDQIEFGVEMLHAPAIGSSIQVLVSILTSYPVLPDKKSLYQEISSLSNKEKDRNRNYIDMILDVYPAGYESAAIWNVLQRNDKTFELKKLINLQQISDQDNHQNVLAFYLKTLKDAAIHGSPYTEIISTQAMALPGLCDAVLEYNKWIKINPGFNGNTISIHQYLTDLPTKGAIHFFNALSSLSTEQQQQMSLHGVNMRKGIVDHFLPQGNHFQAINNIDAKKNPMVRAGFKEAALDNSSKFNQKVFITLAGNDIPYTIEANEQIASIMLGSQAGHDTVNYIETLLESSTNRVFVFGGKNLVIQEKIAEIIANHPEYKNRIIPLGNQGDKEMASLMSRSNLAIIRGGGLSVMEQLAMNHNPEQTILIHHANSNQKKLTSGISWEDENINFLMTNLRKNGVYTVKTSPDLSKRQIAEARLIAAVKRINSNDGIEVYTHYIKKLSDAELKRCVNQLTSSELGPWVKLPPALVEHFESCNEREQNYIDLINASLFKGQIHLAAVILQEVAKMEDINAEMFSNNGQNSSKILPYDVDSIISNFNMPFFNEASHKLISAVQSYQAIKNLQEDIKPGGAFSAHKKLAEFKKHYDSPQVHKALMSNSDNFIRRMIRQIEFYLAQFFPSLIKSFTFQQDLKKCMLEIKSKSELPHEPDVVDKIRCTN